MKVIDKIKAAQEENKVSFSFEFLTPRPKEDLEKLTSMVKRMVDKGPLFCDLTWRPGGLEADLTIETARRMQHEIGVDTILHLTCTFMTVEMVDYALDTARAKGIRNILALKGDPVKGKDPVESPLTCALDLVKHIKAKHGDYFCISVAGYPEAHPSVIPEGCEVAPEELYESDLAYLKQKVDAGADFIVTQLFFDTDVFLKFERDCRQIGITCPIIPGLLAICTYRNYTYMTKMCKPSVPKELKDAIELVKDSEEALLEYGISFGTAMCKKLLAHGVKELHFYTINREKTAVAILQNLGLLNEKIPKCIEGKNENHLAEGIAPFRALETVVPS